MSQQLDLSHAQPLAGDGQDEPLDFVLADIVHAHIRASCARWYAPRPSNGEPVEVIHWLHDRKAAGKYVPGVCLCWELMVGNSNCRWYWGTPEGAPEPTMPWCGLMWPDATPVSLAEGARIRVWFDRMHPSADRDHGLRIDFTDPAPILSGAIGMRTHRVPAWYDNVIVLPIDEQP